MNRVRRNHTYIRIYGVYTVILAVKLPYIRSYTVFMYGYGQPYPTHMKDCAHIEVHFQANFTDLGFADKHMTLAWYQAVWIQIYDDQRRDSQIDALAGSVMPTLYSHNCNAYACLHFILQCLCMPTLYSHNCNSYACLRFILTTAMPMLYSHNCNAYACLRFILQCLSYFVLFHTRLQKKEQVAEMSLWRIKDVHLFERSLPACTLDKGCSLPPLGSCSCLNELHTAVPKRHKSRVGNHIYTVHIRYFWQRNH